MQYEDPACAYCPESVRACRAGESAERGPGYCPTKVDPDGIEAASGKYDDAEIRRIAQVSAVVEAEGYCKWTRVQEICEFAKRMAYKKIGIATCISFVDHAKILSGILESSRLRSSVRRLQAWRHSQGRARPEGRRKNPPRHL